MKLLTTIALSIVCAIGTSAASASDYIHREACQQALLGANGDDDASAFDPGYDLAHWDALFAVHPAADRLIIAVRLYSGSSRKRAVGYCMGDDDHIVDKMGRGYMSRPDGWGPYPIYIGEVPA